MRHVRPGSTNDLAAARELVLPQAQRWRVRQRVMFSPSAIGDIAKAALVLTQFEHKIIS